MCGIIAYIGKKDIPSILLEGLERLEYRGYDSSGIAVIEDNSVKIVRNVGKIENLKKQIGLNFGKNATAGLGHTRWATHGRPSYENAHPQQVGHLAIVHNGIIENYLSIKESLKKRGTNFSSETDTEVIAALILENYENCLYKATAKAVSMLKGSYAIAVISELEPNKIVLAKYDSPLVIGYGEDENFAASDVPAILKYTKNFIYLEDGDIAVITDKDIKIYDASGKEVTRPVKSVNWNPVMAEKQGYKHFMLKEIYEQPRAIIDTIRSRYSLESGTVYLDELESFSNIIKNAGKIEIIGCGTSWHSSLIGKYFLEKFAKIPTYVEIASEYRYKTTLADEKTILIPVSQSGETADTIGAAKLAKKNKPFIIGISNMLGSSLSRLSNATIYTHAGPEIGVASTKAFLTQIVLLYLLSLYIGNIRKTISTEETTYYLKALTQLPEKLEKVLKLDSYIEEIARTFKDYKHFLYLGRNLNYPVALEGSLKLKEISYIHAEGYPAGEIKHGPIALVSKEVPVFFIATKSKTYEKIVSNIEEIKSRGGRILSIVTEGDDVVKGISDITFEVPDIIEELSICQNTAVMQLFAYRCANHLGLDVDQPRNLAKSVTVE